MIVNVSKAVTLYLAPVLSLTALLLALFSFLAPVLMLHNEVALLSVTPSNTLTNPQKSSSDVDGPTLRLGALGSCGRFKNADSLNCTSSTLSPTYDLSVLPSGSPDLISSPTATTPAFIAVSLVFSSLFVIVFTLISFRTYMGEKVSAWLDKPFVSSTVAWIGLLGFMIGLTANLVLRMWIGKAVDDFNRGITEQGQKGSPIVASVGNGFTMVWVAYAFLAIPIVCSLAKLHVTAGGK